MAENPNYDPDYCYECSGYGDNYYEDEVVAKSINEAMLAGMEIITTKMKTENRF